jgi:hypothetical protein
MPRGLEISYTCAGTAPLDARETQPKWDQAQIETGGPAQMADRQCPALP